MAVTDNGNFDLAIEATEELLTAALVAMVQPPVVGPGTITTPQFSVRPELLASVTRADCRSGAAATVSLLGTVTGNLIVESVTLPGGGGLPADPAYRRIAINSAFEIITNPRVGSVGGTRGVVFPISTAQVQVTLDESAVLSSFPVQLLLIAAFITGGTSGYEQRRTEILDLMRDALAKGLRAGVARAGTILVLAEPGGLSFRAVLTTNATMKVLITIAPPDGNEALISGLTVRRNSIGGPLDHAALVISNAHLLGTLLLPLATTALGIPGTPSNPAHPCLLLGGIPLPGATFGIPTLTGGAPVATVFLDLLLGQIDATGLRLDVTLRAVSFGSFGTVLMRASVTAPVTATIAGGTLTIAPGVPSVSTTTRINVNPAVYLAAVATGGLVLLVLTALLDTFGGDFIDGFVRASIVSALTRIVLPSVTLPLAGPFAALAVNNLQTTEPTAPVRTFTVAGFTVPLDRANDVIIRLA